MITRKQFMIISAVVCVVMLFAAPVTAKTAIAKTVITGETWTVTETTKLYSLTIEEGGIVTASEGYSLTMTVNGIGTAIKAGTYTGYVVLTPTEEVKLEYNGMGVNDTYYFRTGIYIKDGLYVPEKSVPAIVRGGKITDSYAKYIRMTSNEDEFNGIIVSGDSSYSIINPRIYFTGNGGNDFAGFGAAIMTEGNADVVMDHAKIITNGVVRTAVWVGGNSTIQVNNSYIETHTGTLPDDYAGGPFGGGGVMMEVPWMLGITGNCRATNVLGTGTAYYNNSHVKAQAWGALSTDACQDVKLYATNSKIEVIDSGYGAYADGTSLDTFSHCYFDVPDYGLIMTNGSAVFTDRTIVKSGRFGVMSHSSQGANTLTINDGSAFYTKKAVILLKSSNPSIVADNAKLHSENGIILQAMVNDDPMAGMGGPAGGGAKTINAAFSNMSMTGDIINTMTSLGDVNITLQNAAIKGAITTGTAEWVGTYPRTIDNLTDMGEVTNTYGATSDTYGITAALDGSSKWIVDKTSYLTGLTIAEGAVIAAPKCYTLTMTVDGVDTPIAAGTYAGGIVLTVAEGGNCHCRR